MLLVAGEGLCVPKEVRRASFLVVPPHLGPEAQERRIRGNRRTVECLCEMKEGGRSGGNESGKEERKEGN
jgi:hypothetical protein